MPTFTRGETALHYEVHGSGHPLLLLAPGGMRSSIPFWERSPFHPLTELVDQFQVIAMDQRNAGASRAPISTADGWHTYTDDHLALLDDLGIECCHLHGGCIGGAFALSLIARAPERVSAAVLQQPIGLTATNRHVFYELFDGWANELRQTRRGVPEQAWAPFRSRMFDGEFVFSVDRDAVRACPVPLLVLRSVEHDEYHPQEISDEIVRLSPRAELVPEWKTGAAVGRAVQRVREFLAEHTPS